MWALCPASAVPSLASSSAWVTLLYGSPLRTLAIVFRAHCAIQDDVLSLISLTLLYLPRLFFQVRSHSQALGMWHGPVF